MPTNDTERRAFNQVFSNPADGKKIVDSLPALTVDAFISALGLSRAHGLAAWLGSLPSTVIASGLAAIKDAVDNGLSVEIIHRPTSSFRLEMWEASVPTGHGKDQRTGTLTLLLSGPSESLPSAT